MRISTFLILFSACGPPNDGTPSIDEDGAIVTEVGTDTTVTIFDHALQNFGDPNTRNIETTAVLPDPALWSEIKVKYRLDCPTGGCDPWDRWANLEVMVGDVPIEIDRVITPYGVGGTWRTDVTDMAPILSGERTFRSNIDTWIGGEQGWELTVELIYTGGTPDRIPVAVEPVFNAWVLYGDEINREANQLPPVSVTSPANTESMRVRALITGHGQGNEDNCAEFCARTHTLSAGDDTYDLELWRDDCADNKINDQAGNWRPNRAGWCPGDDVDPIEWDVGDVSGDVTVAWTPEPYLNRCGGTEACSNCPAGFPGCAYDGGGHTEPRYSVSAVAIFFFE